MEKRILVIDDEQRIVDVLAKLLFKEGFIVLTATDGENGLMLAKKTVPDLIVLDVMMPEMDGGEVARNLLQDEKTKNIPIIFLTGVISEKEIIKSGGRIGKRLFMSKASDLNEQITTIKKTLGIGA